MPTDNQRSPEYWRSRAAEARAMRENARDAKVRAYLAEIAQEYERLAKIADSKYPPWLRPSVERANARMADRQKVPLYIRLRDRRRAP